MDNDVKAAWRAAFYAVATGDSDIVYLQEIAGACDIVHLQEISSAANNVYLQEAIGGISSIIHNNSVSAFHLSKFPSAASASIDDATGIASFSFLCT